MSAKYVVRPPRSISISFIRSLNITQNRRKIEETNSSMKQYFYLKMRQFATVRTTQHAPLPKQNTATLKYKMAKHCFCLYKSYGIKTSPPCPNEPHPGAAHGHALHVHQRSCGSRWPYWYCWLGLFKLKHRGDSKNLIVIRGRGLLFYCYAKIKTMFYDAKRGPKKSGDNFSKIRQTVSEKKFLSIGEGSDRIFKYHFINREIPNKMAILKYIPI